MSVRTCPLCELRFNFLTELEWHLTNDHDRDWASSDRTWARADHRPTRAGSDPQSPRTPPRGRGRTPDTASQDEVLEEIHEHA